MSSKAQPSNDALIDVKHIIEHHSPSISRLTGRWKAEVNKVDTPYAHVLVKHRKRCRQADTEALVMQRALHMHIS